MSTQGASSLWGGSSTLGGLDSNWGIGTPFPSGANNMNLLGYGGNSSLSNNQGHMQSGASTLGDSVNSNPLMGRGGWGAPGAINKPASSSGNMQGSLPVSGAQPNGPQSSQPSGSFTTSQSPGPNIPSSQGNSAFGSVGFQKTSTGNVSSGLAINPATSIMNSANSGSSAQSSDNVGSSGWGLPSTTQDSRLSGTTSWGNPSGSEWDQSSSSSASQSQSHPSASGSQFQSAGTGMSAGQDQQRPSSWAQAAGRGLNLQASNQNPSNTMSQEEIQRQAMIRTAIESHDGWGKKPIRQDTQWSVETSPKVQRKISTASVVPDQQKGTNNMWNNNNGTAIWEANKDSMSAWGGNQGVQVRAPGQPPTNWPGAQQKPPETPGSSQWGVGQGQAPGADKSMGPWGAPGNPSSSNGNWGGSTETGSWGGNFGSSTPGASGGMSTWGDSDGTSWGESRNSGGNDGTSYWGDPSGKPPGQQPNWNAPGGGQQAIGQNRKIGSGWGDPMGPPDPKIDDGTGLWSSTNQPPQMQGRPANWGGDAGNPQWNNPGAIGKPTPKVASVNPAQFGGVDELNWNLPKEGAIKFPGPVGNQPPQMRSRLLQQLMEMGFKKDEAQHALITNNMNIQHAISDLYSRRGAMPSKKDEMEMARMSSLLADSAASDDISDTQSDSNSFVPNVNPMQNTPMMNAQSKMPSQFPFTNGPSLNTSSLGSNNPSINNALQQKIVQKFQSQQPPPPTPSVNSIAATQGPLGRGQLAGGQQNPAVHQQMAQQQILQQLRLSVQAGLISPQLLNQKLPAPVLVMLQELLQQQQNLQQLLSTQQMLQTPKVNMNPHIQRQQLEQVGARINQIKQQILMIQRNISQAQNSLLKTQSQQQQPPNPADNVESSLQSELNNLSLQPQSRLTQWKRPTPDKESPDGSPATSENPTNTATTTTSSSSSEISGDSLNKTVGPKAIQQSSSTPNLRGFNELGLTQLGGDSTWSTSASSASQNWPNEGSPVTSGSNASSSDNKESLTSTSVVSSGNSSVLDSIPAIPEFVPGKPWQGITKSVEDDPHITPGSFSRSLSVNTIKDDYLLTLTKSSPTNENNSTWPSKPVTSSSQGLNKPWSAGDSSLTPTSFTSDVWGVPKGAMSRPPPGLPQQGKSGWGVNRQQSWAGSSVRSDGGNNWGGSAVSSALMLKNLTPQIDGSTLRTLCMQHGPLQYFHLNLAHGQALVKYRNTEEAAKAQKALNTCLLSNTTIVAEFVPEAEALRFVEHQNAMTSVPSQWSQMSQPRQASAIGNQRQDMTWSITPPSSMTGTGMWGNSSVGSSSGLWDSGEDNSAHNLLGNMLGDHM